MHAHDNEALSAALAVDCLRAAGAGDEVARRVLGLIMATRHHQPGGDPDCTILLDIDLAILGATPERFAEYERQVRQEYAHVPEANYREARALVMQGFLARPRIFATATFFERYEARARANLGA